MERDDFSVRPLPRGGVTAGTASWERPEVRSDALGSRSGASGGPVQRVRPPLGSLRWERPTRRSGPQEVAGSFSGRSGKASRITLQPRSFA